MNYRVKQATAWVSRVVSSTLHRDRPWLSVIEFNFGVNPLPQEFDGYRIAQFSDLHFDGISTTSERLRELVTTINERQPDLIVFTGDFITQDVPYRIEDLIAPLSELQAHDAKVAIMGNHDHRINTGLIQRVIRESGMIDLNNAVYSIRRGENTIYIAGVDSLTRQKARLDLVMRELPETGYAILLAHEPAFADVSAATGRFGAQLSGHTHGGQIRLPLLTPRLLTSVNPLYLRRVFRVGGMLVHVNRGIGMVGLPVRVRCPSEVTIIRLRSVN